MWNLWSQSKTFKTPPATLLGIDDDLTAFYFNRAVWVFGVTLEEEIEKARASRKGQRRQEMAVNMLMHRWLGVGKFANAK
jgi:hypothetical protein